MERPRPLIGSTEEGRLFLDKNTVEIVTNMSQNIAVVSIVGKYRTGKSYLMNRLFNSNTGFQVGPTVAAATKGIWVWAQEHPKFPGKMLLVLDIEGLHDPKKGDSTHDLKLFSLAVLLSSCLVYNLVGALDSAFLQEFHLVSKLTDIIRIDAKNEETGTEFSQHFPKLVFVLRDFFLKLDIKGKQVTPDEYMNDTLKLKPGRGKAVSDYNEPRECIRDFFPNRKCFVLPRPNLKNQNDIQRMDQLQDKDIDNEFLSKVKETIDYILQEAQGFKVLGHDLNGPRFIQLLKVYVSGLNKGTLPPITTAIESVKAKQCKMAINNAVQLYRQMMSSSLEGALPIESVDLMELHKSAYNMAVEQYKEQAMIDVKSAAILKDVIEEAYKNFQRENEEVSKAKCSQLLEKLFEFTTTPDQFLGPGGFSTYMANLNSAKQSYSEVRHKGPLAEEMLRTFLRETQTVHENILNSDSEIPEKEKAEIRQTIVQKRKIDDDETEAEYKKKLRTDLLRQQEENMKLFDKMRKEFEERQDYLMRKYKEDMGLKEAEHRRLQQENMAKQSEKMEELLKSMKMEYKNKDVIIQKQQKQIEQFKKKTEELINRLEDEKITKKELLATMSQFAPVTPTKRSSCTSPISNSQGQPSEPDDTEPGPSKRRKTDSATSQPPTTYIFGSKFSASSESFQNQKDKSATENDETGTDPITSKEKDNTKDASAVVVSLKEEKPESIEVKYPPGYKQSDAEPVDNIHPLRHPEAKSKTATKILKLIKENENKTLAESEKPLSNEELVSQEGETSRTEAPVGEEQPKSNESSSNTPSKSLPPIAGEIVSKMSQDSKIISPFSKPPVYHKKDDQNIRKSASRILVYHTEEEMETAVNEDHEEEPMSDSSPPVGAKSPQSRSSSAGDGEEFAEAVEGMIMDRAERMSEEEENALLGENDDAQEGSDSEEDFDFDQSKNNSDFAEEHIESGRCIIS